MTTRKLNMIVVCSALAMTAGFVALLLLPGSRELGEKQKQIDERAAKVKSDQELVGDVGSLYASIMELDSAMADYRVRLPKDRQFAEFLNSIAENLKRNGIDDYNVHPQEVLSLETERLPEAMRIAKDTLIVPVHVSFQARFEDVFGFLDGIEGLERVSHVESLKLTNDEGSPGTVHADLMLHTYYESDQNQV